MERFIKNFILIDTIIETILTRIARWISEGSGWVIEEVLSHYLNIASYLPLRGSSYIKLPKELRNSRKGLINLKNEDDQCFPWCHVRHLNPLGKKTQRITEEDQAYVKNLDYTGVTFPVTLKDIGTIEKQNSMNVNVFGYDNGVYPIRISKGKFEDHLELLWIVATVRKREELEGIVRETEELVDKSHYVLIKDFDRLMASFNKQLIRYLLRALFW